MSNSVDFTKKDDGQLAPCLLIRNAADIPVLLKRHAIEESQRSDGLVEHCPGNLSLPDQVLLIAVDVLQSQLVWGTHEITNELFHAAQVALLGIATEPPNLEIPLHTVSVLTHQFLLCGWQRPKRTPSLESSRSVWVGLFDWLGGRKQSQRLWRRVSTNAYGWNPVGGVAGSGMANGLGRG